MNLLINLMRSLITLWTYELLLILFGYTHAVFVIPHLALLALAHISKFIHFAPMTIPTMFLGVSVLSFLLLVSISYVHSVVFLSLLFWVRYRYGTVLGDIPFHLRYKGVPGDYDLFFLILTLLFSDYFSNIARSCLRFRFFLFYFFFFHIVSCLRYLFDSNFFQFFFSSFLINVSLNGVPVM